MKFEGSDKTDFCWEARLWGAKTPNSILFYQVILVGHNVIAFGVGFC